ncbi:uncharacterized protein [Arachis hypogaea]|uniref:uncharacterized protein n=1 Tax=Arachis hypogaea TaxID=3818 RepID=UPI003B22697F
MEALETQDMDASKKNYKKSNIEGNSLGNNLESNKKEKHKKRKRRHEIDGEATRNSEEEGFTSRKKKRKRLQKISASMASKRHKFTEDNDLESAVSSTDLRVPKKSRVRFVEEENYADEVLPFMEQLLNDEDLSQTPNISDSINSEQDEELEAKRVRGPTLLKKIWNMPRGKTIDVQFNNRNQAIRKEGRKLASFLGILARTPSIMPLNIDDWRCYDKEEKNKLLKIVRKKFSIPVRGEEFVKRSIGKKWKDYKCDLKGIYLGQYKTKDVLLKNRPERIPRDQWIGLVSYWFSDKAKKRTQANRINRAKQKMPHTGGSKSIATLMDELAKDGIEPSRTEIFLKIHRRRKDGRPLDEESAKAVELIEEKLNNGELSNEESINGVAWEGDIYSQVLGSDRSGYVRGLGLGPTPSLLWGNKSSYGKFVSDALANEVAQKLQQEIKVLKEKHEEEMKLMKENQNKMFAELSFMRQVLCKLVSTGSSMTQNFNENSFMQVPDANSGHELAPSST